MGWQENEEDEVRRTRVLEDDELALLDHFRKLTPDYRQRLVTIASFGAPLIKRMTDLVLANPPTAETGPPAD